MNSSPSDYNVCLCGSGLDYVKCCEPYHRGERNPPTAEALMRSRYTAYALRNSSYLLASWDARKRPAVIDFSAETAQWRQLIIIRCKRGGVRDSVGIVEFKAIYIQDGGEHLLHEISNFVKTGSRWLYVDGVIKAAGRAPAEFVGGRNAPCACGSGNKFKRCCGR